MRQQLSRKPEALFRKSKLADTFLSSMESIFFFGEFTVVILLYRESNLFCKFPTYTWRWQYLSTIFWKYFSTYIMKFRRFWMRWQSFEWVDVNAVAEWGPTHNSACSCSWSSSKQRFCCLWLSCIQKVASEFGLLDSI